MSTLGVFVPPGATTFGATITNTLLSIVAGMTAGAVDPCPLGPNPDIMSPKPNDCFEETMNLISTADMRRKAAV